jgi:flagellar hook-associated protein 3 FlgL
MRVTNKMTYDMIEQSLSRRTERIMKINRSIASGKRINEPSDDPLAMTRVLEYRTSLASMDQYAKNIDQGLSWLKTGESSLYEANQLLVRTKELVLSQVTGTATHETRQATAAEVLEIFEQMIQLADTRLGERFIFSGFKTDTAPFPSVSDYTYRGDTGAIQIEIAKNQKVTINLNGSEIFTDSSVSILQTLDDVVTHLRNDDVSGLEGDIDTIDSSVDHILATLAEVGAKTRQLESTKDNFEDLRLNVTELLSNLEDTDLAEAVTELSLQETAYQASLASAARLLETSLLDFLR